MAPKPSEKTWGEILERPHERPEERTEEPELFNVYLINDDYTTMDFVVEVLELVFLKSPSEAYGVMMTVHTQGRGLAGVYPFEVAETKVATVADLAQQAGFPLQAAMEPAA
jgi:ATP-dependent Clp protease adaptor protein ClpS